MPSEFELNFYNKILAQFNSWLRDIIDIIKLYII
jgi:hypothetical protein